MSDFEFVGESNHIAPEEDPAADFLAREQDELAGLNDDNVNTNVNSNEVQNDYDNFGGEHIVNNISSPDLPFELEVVMPVQLKDAEVSVETKSPDLPFELEVVMPVQLKDAEVLVETKHQNGPSDSVPSSGSNRYANREEPEKIKKWREEQQKMLEIKDAEEEKKKKELQDSAKKEIDEWYARYKEQIEKSKLNNRNAEKDWIADRDAESPGQEWERITRLCDFNPKSSRSTKDTSRMRSIILQLKQTPINPQKAS